MPGMSFVSGIISHFRAGPAFRTALVSGAAPGETAYTAMPEGSRRASAAAHQATMSFASAYARLASYFTFGPLRSRAFTAALRSPWCCVGRLAHPFRHPELRLPHPLRFSKGGVPRVLGAVFIRHAQS